MTADSSENPVAEIPRGVDLYSGVRGTIPYIGDQVGDHVIVDILGWGKSTVVYKISEISSGNVFAMKLLAPHALTEEEATTRFYYEIEIMSKVDHPNLVHLHDHGVSQNCPYFIMDVIRGVNLENYLISRGRPAMKVFFGVAKDAAAALAYLHQLEILHRDVKLKNIMIDFQTHDTKIMDLGIATEPRRDLSITDETRIVGTPHYMAPELFQGDAASIKSDVYAFGATLYHFATGTPPFTGNNIYEIYNKHSSGKPRSILFSRPTFPHDLENLIIERCLAKVPEDRPNSLEDVLKELNDIQARYRDEGTNRPERTLLLVDDERNVLSSLTRLLRGLPYEVIISASADDALERVERRAPGVMITDQRMPGMTGVELASKVALIRPETIVMILSGQSDVEDVMAAINAGNVYKFLTKPWNDDDLKVTIQRAFEQYELRERNKRLRDILERHGISEESNGDE